MDKNTAQYLFEGISSDVVRYHIEKNDMTLQEAISTFHNSETFSALEDFETGLRKIGGILADGADVGCGCVINPGTVIGKKTSVYPLTSLRGVYPANCIVKSQVEVVVRRED